MTAALGSGSAPPPPLPQPRPRADPEQRPQPFEATRQPSSGPPKATNLRANPLTGTWARSTPTSATFCSPSASRATARQGDPAHAQPGRDQVHGGRGHGGRLGAAGAAERRPLREPSPLEPGRPTRTPEGGPSHQGDRHTGAAPPTGRRVTPPDAQSDPPRLSSSSRSGRRLSARRRPRLGPALARPALGARIAHRTSPLAPRTSHLAPRTSHLALSRNGPLFPA